MAAELRMHVGLYSPTWPPGDAANGIVTYVRIVRDELLRRGHRVTIFSAICKPSESGDVVQLSAVRRSIVGRSLRRLLGSHLSGPFGFGSVIADTVVPFHARDPLDIFEMEESFGWSGTVAARLPAPTVVKLHGPAFLSLIDGGSETPERRSRIEREGKALRTAAAVVAPSPSTLAATAARYSLTAKVLSAIPNPVSPADDAQLWNAELSERDHILYVGRFDFRKGGDTILKAFGRIVATRPSAHLTFVGPDSGLRLPSGELQHIRDHLRANFPPEVVERVRYVGIKTPGEIAELRSKAAVTVATTRWESFGYAVAESMNQGCPIVAFDVAGVNELIEHEKTGLLAPLDDIDTLTRLIVRLLEDPALAASLGRRARESVLASCGADVVLDRMLALYEDVISDRRTGRRA